MTSLLSQGWARNSLQTVRRFGKSKFATIAGALFLTMTVAAEAVPVTVLSTNAGKTFSDIATDGSNIFVVSDATAIFSLPGTGGGASQLYMSPPSSSTAIYAITLIGNDLYWGDAQSGPVTDSQIFKAPKTGGGPITAIYTGVSSGQPIVDITGLETDGTKLYTADAVQGRVHSLNPDGSGLTQLGPNRYGGFFAGAHVNSIAVGDGKVFIGESAVPTAAGCSGECNPGIYSHTADDASGSFATLKSDPPFAGEGVRGIIFGDGLVFATQGDTIYSILSDGSALNTLTDLEFHDLRGITFFGGSLYVVDEFAGNGRVLRVDLGTAVPLPGTLALILIGLGGIFARGYLRREGRESP